MSAARDATTSVDITVALLDHLRAMFGLGEEACYLIIDPDDNRRYPGGEFWMSLTVGDADYPEEQQQGGGRFQLWEYRQFTAVAYSRIRSGAANPDDLLLLDERRGLLTAGHRLLAALSLRDLPATLANLLVDIPIAVSSTAPQWDQERSVGRVGVTWRIGYWIDLGQEDAPA